MPIASNIVLADAQATPVNHTFIPIGRDSKGVFWFEDPSSSNSVGYMRISVETRRPDMNRNGKGTNQRTFRTIIGLHEPVLEVLGTNSAGFMPAPTVAYISRTFCEFIDPERSSSQNRKNMSKMVPLLLQNLMIQKIVENHEELSF